MIAERSKINRRTTKTRSGDPNPPRKTDWLHIWAYAWERPLVSALLAFEFYGLLTIWHGLKTYGSAVYQSAFPYFNYLADAFLHGELHLRLIPAETNDLVLWHGQYFLYWPPLPAFLLAPFVAVFGVQFSDAAFTMCVAVFNVPLVAVLMRVACSHSVIHLNRPQRGLLVSCFTSAVILFAAVFSAAPVFFTPLDWERYYLLPITFSSIFIAIGMSKSVAFFGDGWHAENLLWGSKKNTHDGAHSALTFTSKSTR